MHVFYVLWCCNFITFYTFPTLSFCWHRKAYRIGTLCVTVSTFFQLFFFFFFHKSFWYFAACCTWSVDLYVTLGILKAGDINSSNLLVSFILSSHVSIANSTRRFRWKLTKFYALWQMHLSKHCMPRWDCSSRSSLIRAYVVCHSICIFWVLIFTTIIEIILVIPRFLTFHVVPFGFIPI